MRFEDYVAERCAIAAREAREEALEEGLEEDRGELSALARALKSADRAVELVPALEDQTLLDSLLEEFGIGTWGDNSAES